MQVCTQSSVPTPQSSRSQASASSSCVRAGFSRIPGSVYEASLAVPRRAGDSWLLVSARSHHLQAGKVLPLLATMERATLLRAATAYLHARDVRALRITAPAARSNAIGVPRVI